MRVFVLTPGRSGSVTFAAACSHMTNFTAAHESRAQYCGPDRFDYPDDHIEVDNRLSWFTGGLAETFPDARYVHLIRDRDATAASYQDRWISHPPRPSKRRSARIVAQLGSRHPRTSLISAFGNGLLLRSAPWPEAERQEVSRFMVDTIHANIRVFLATRPHMTIHLESAADGFGEFWDWIGAHGDRAAALNEWTVRHNARRTKTRAA